MILLGRFLYQAHVLEEANEIYGYSSPDYFANEMACFQTRIDSQTYDLVMSIHGAAGKIMHYVSASNWATYYDKIKNAVHTLSIISDNTEASLTELRLLECCCLTRSRLSTVLTDLSPYFLNIENETKLLFAKLMRIAIWRWIESYPAEFSEMYESDNRLMNGSDILFDLCNSNADSPRRKAIIWPLRSLLLILSPDVLIQAYLDGPSSQNRRAAFLKMLGKTLRTARSTEIAALCYVDFCRAATYVSPTENSVLRHIAIDVEDDLRECVWNISRFSVPQPSITNGGYTIDQQAFATDYLLARLRLDTTKTLHNIVPVCLEDGAPVVFKMALVKACLAIVQEDPHLPWNPKIESMYPLLCGYLRNIFLPASGYEYGTMSRMESVLGQLGPRRAQLDKNPRKDIKLKEKENTMILEDILRLYRADPLLVLMGKEEDPLESHAAVMAGMTQLLQHPEQNIRQLSSECLIKLHDHKHINLWGPFETRMPNFWRISSQIGFLMARQILEKPKDDEGNLFLMNLKGKLCATRSIFIRNNAENANDGSSIKIRIQSAVAIEVALLLTMCSPKPELCSASTRCIGYLCAETNFITGNEFELNEYSTMLRNLDIYKEIVREDTTFIGRKAQQKRLRKYLRMLSTPTPGILAAWEEAWKRWKALTGPLSLSVTDAFSEELNDGTIGKRGQPIGPGRDKIKSTASRLASAYQSRTESKEDMRVEWENYAGFLSSLGGCCLIKSPFTDNFTLVGAKKSVEYVQDFRRVYSPTEPEIMVDRFMFEMVELLASDKATIRESVREILGVELSPELYSNLFKHLEIYMATFFNADEKAMCDPSKTIFVDLVVVILKSILDRLVDPNDFLLSVNFSTLTRYCTFYIDQLPNSQTSIRAKIKVANMIETLVLKKEQVVVRDEMRLRNKLLEVIVEWTSGFALPTMAIQDLTHGQKLQRDLDQASLRAIATLLHQLPLQTSEPVSESEASQQPESMNDWGALKDNTILAMSNLLNANVETGLKYSLAMAYHEDSRTRTAFMQVLANILDEGAKFDSLADNLMSDRYEQMIDVLIDSDISVVMSLCSVCPPSDTASIMETILVCYESREKTMDLLKEVITKEVASTEQEATLFRGTTVATQLLSIFAQNCCGAYIQSTLQSVMDEINMLPEHMQTWELDAQKLRPGEDIATNKENVVHATEILLNAICSSSNKAPMIFRKELSLIVDAVGARFSEAKYSAVGGFVILRLFGPAIVAPENTMFSKLTTSRTGNVRKLLLQATRIIQNLANNVFFGAKETHMIVLNDFLTSNIYKVAGFLREISTVPSQENMPIPTPVIQLDHKTYHRVHRYISDNFERMGRDLSERKVKEISDTQKLLEWKRTLDKLSSLLAQLGRPPEISQKDLATLSVNYSNANNNHYYCEFINRNRYRDVTAISSLNIFYQGGVSRSGRPVFYMILNKAKGENFDFELLTYYALCVMEPYIKKPFELLLDTTCLNTDCHMPAHWLNQLVQLIFSEINDTFAALYIFNPNTQFQKYVRKLPRVLANRLLKRTSFMFSMVELQEYIAPSELRLPKSTVDIDKEKCIVFSPVVRIANMVLSIPVTIKLGPEYLQITTVRKQEMLWGLNSVLNDIYHISEIDNLFPTSNSKTTEGGGGNFCIKTDHGRTTLTFSTSKRNAILALLRFNKTRYDEITKPANIHENSINPTDVPGRLLNMALLNIGSSDPELRVSAYSLLCSLSVAFRFDVGNQLMHTRDLCIPANSTTFIINISKILANTESQLTLEFLAESFAGLYKSDKQLQMLCLEYTSPWLRNLAIFGRGGSNNNSRSLTKTKEILRLFIELTVSQPTLYKHIQAKVWKPLADVDDMVNLILESFIQYSVESGVGSLRAESLADTFVTMASTSVRAKVISRMRNTIQRTLIQPCKNLADHPAWAEIAVLLRFLLMLSFNNVKTARPYLPEIFHIVSLLVATGPAFIRASVHELVINVIHTLCTSSELTEDNEKKLQFLLNDVCDTKCRLNFGLIKSHGNAFVISPEANTDASGPLNLTSLESVVRLLLDVLSIGASSTDIANMWRARWMSLVTSTTFQFNPAIQPRSFVVLGCLAQDEVDDDLIYQILIALKRALEEYDESDSYLVVSIMMCLGNIIHHLPANSRYVKSLFWIAIALVQMNRPAIFPAAIQLLQSVLQALDDSKLFVHRSLADVLMDARKPMADIARDIDLQSGVNFDTHFSFAVAGILLKGLINCDPKDNTIQCLTTFLEIDCKRSVEQNIVKARTIGYLAVLLPFAVENGALRELLRLAGIDDIELDGIEFESSYVQIFDTLEIPDNTTGLLLVSLLVTMVNASDNESERLFLYEFLAEAAVSIPEVFSLVYEALLPKMNQIVVSSQNFALIDTIKAILLTACSEPVFNTTNERRNQKTLLEEIEFPALADTKYVPEKPNPLPISMLISKLLAIIE
ncbi:hypothetical protein CLU79DRAFT_697324 [Phycomyces nitens]|nr:hypothetical protein CLU79DRAFT_697324 [Phycomyces nitens]